MGQRSIYNSTHKPQLTLDETLGFNHDDHLHRMCNETGIPEFLGFQIPGIPMVTIVTSCAPYLYISVTRVSSSEGPSRVRYAK